MRAAFEAELLPPMNPAPGTGERSRLQHRDMSQRILVVEDETNLAQILVDYLKRDGFAADTVADGLAAMDALRRTPPDLLLLDIMLPGMDGLAILRELRKTSTLPVILMTARVEEIDRLIGLELGADDYVCKPYSPREVVARVKTVLRRTQPAPASAAAAATPALEIDGETWQARVGGKRLDLTPKEFRLLQALAAKPGRVFSRGQLLDTLYEDNLDVSERAVDSHMKNLRKKLAQALPDAEPIRSIYGVGFVFEP
jgi:two-component system response regulator BaeR